MLHSPRPGGEGIHREGISFHRSMCPLMVAERCQYQNMDLLKNRKITLREDDVCRSIIRYLCYLYTIA